MKLEKFMRDNGLTDKKVGKALKVAKMTVYRYRKGMIRPSNKVLEKIYKFTEGLVTPNDFYELNKKN